MDVINKRIDAIKPYENNPRKNDAAVQYVANSIREFGFKQPIVVDRNGVIVAGHTRYKAAIELGLEEVPCIMADDLTDEQVKAYRLADNKVAEASEWDFDLLEKEMNGIYDIDLEQFGFSAEGEVLDDNKYTAEINIPQYEVAGESVTLGQLVDTSWADELIEEIEASQVSEAEKSFLIEAAKRHNRFNYRNIAEYYAEASEEMQRLMERSALVIIDFDDAIKNGYVQLSKDMEGFIDDE